jgi:hypothetical protein
MENNRMEYNLNLNEETILHFEVYNYNYKDIDLINQFDINFPNIVVLFQKTEDTFKLISAELVENLSKYFVTGLTQNNLYITDKVLLLKGSRPPNIDQTIEYLNGLLLQIQKVIPNVIPNVELES